MKVIFRPDFAVDGPSLLSLISDGPYPKLHSDSQSLIDPVFATRSICERDGYRRLPLREFFLDFDAPFPCFRLPFDSSLFVVFS